MERERSLQGRIEEIIYENEENGYKICDVDCHGELVTIRGSLPFLHIGERIRATGHWETHKAYGEQFIVENYEKELPTSIEDIHNFLSSGLINGVGSVTAALIVERFGESALHVMMEKPEELESIRGISHNKAMKIGQAFREQFQMSNIVMFFQRYGIGTNLAVKVYKKYGGSAVDVVESNPYRLVEDITGIGFRTADQIAQSLGLPKDSYNRICAGLLHLLSEGYQNGHVFLPEEQLLRLGGALLESTREDVVHCLGLLEQEIRVVIVEGQYGKHVYLRYLFECEQFVAQKLHALANYHFTLDERHFEDSVRQFENRSHLILDTKQLAAIRVAGEHGVSIITGGPGTGKTTIIKAVMQLLFAGGLRCMLAAPTGRAAKRMTETCGMEAKTIHRLLEVNYGMSEEPDLDVRFNKGEKDPLDTEALIIDETSMVDILLLYHLLKATKPGTRLIFVGDKDQLPSVGPGKVLRDLIASDCFPVVVLDEIYRQESESLIAVNAHRINRGEMPDLNVRDKDFFLLRRRTQQDCLNAVTELCVSRLPKAYGIDPFQDLQVIIPTKKGVCGVRNANMVLQSVLNPSSPEKKEKELHGVLFREGDRVMQIRNNYEIEWRKASNSMVKGNGVFNGEMGILEQLDGKAKQAVVVFDDDRVVVYDWQNLTDLEHCYAVTVHKSQGSEFDFCVIPVFPTTPMLMTRNLLYTAITRAKKLAVLVGSEDCLRNMIANNAEQLRYTGLREALQDK